MCAENSRRNLPGRCVITITICYSNDASESHTLKEKIIHQMYMDDIKLFVKNEKESNPNTGGEDTQ